MAVISSKAISFFQYQSLVIKTASKMDILFIMMDLIMVYKHAATRHIPFSNHF
jgi:hypothetical protein